MTKFRVKVVNKEIKQYKKDQIKDKNCKTKVKNNFKISQIRDQIIKLGLKIIIKMAKNGIE